MDSKQSHYKGYDLEANLITNPYTGWSVKITAKDKFAFAVDQKTGTPDGQMLMRECPPPIHPGDDEMLLNEALSAAVAELDGRFERCG